MLVGKFVLLVTILNFVAGLRVSMKAGCNPFQAILGKKAEGDSSSSSRPVLVSPQYSW